MSGNSESNDDHGANSPLSSLTRGGRYEVERRLGEGGFSTTYLAKDTRDGRDVVIKRLRIETIGEVKTLDLFEREAKLLQGLDHPDIPRFVEAFTEHSEESSSVCLVHEFIEGQSLRERIDAGRRLDESEALGLADRVANIFEYLHGLSPRIIHRDIKPGNIILRPDGTACLIDFGAARDRMLSDAHSQGGGSTVVGTFGYMPHEQYEGRALPATDIYGLGVSLLHALSRIEPWTIKRRAMRLQFRDHINVSEGFQRVLEKMLEPDWESRYASAAALRHDLALVTRGKLPGSMRARKRAYVVAGTLAIASLGVGLGTLLGASNSTSQQAIAESEQAQAQAPGVARPVTAEPLEIVPSRPAAHIYDGRNLNYVVFEDQAAFLSRLGAQPGRLGFDDVDVTGPPVQILGERYREEGVLLEAEQGMYVHPDFGVPAQFAAPSPPNSLIVGPPEVGARSRVLRSHFVADGSAAAVSAIGVSFLDADHFTAAPSSVSVFDPDQRRIAHYNVRGSNAGHTFVGIVVVDEDGQLAPVIANVLIEHGNQWPTGTTGDAVSLDDLLFSAPVALPAD